jgi:cold-inducible RNA-binding protein
MNIFVAKLNFSTSSDGLREAFEQFGQVESASVVTDRESGRSKGFGFVEMPDDNEAQAAINALEGSDLDGRTIAVKKAEPRESRGGGGGFGGGGGNRGGGGGYGGGGNRGGGGGYGGGGNRGGGGYR